MDLHGESNPEKLLNTKVLPQLMSDTCTLILFQNFCLRYCNVRSERAIPRRKSFAFWKWSEKGDLFFSTLLLNCFMRALCAEFQRVRFVAGCRPKQGRVFHDL